MAFGRNSKKKKSLWEEWDHSRPVLCYTGEEGLGHDVRLATVQGVVGSELREPDQGPAFGASQV